MVYLDIIRTHTETQDKGAMGCYILSKNSEKKNKKGEGGEVRFCDVVDLTCVPKKYRTEGCVVSSKWVDTSTGKTSYHKAEVLKISSK